MKSTIKILSWLWVAWVLTACSTIVAISMIASDSTSKHTIVISPTPTPTASK